ncbi:hypothetical protein A9Z63_07255 [Moraxella lacunata]|jgi:hypothetical protein|uniref:Uncharacterized protein n=1 Tax=Moraxella lacunata TaxID=477 RepID=A0A1B8PV17_MORLA|nr:hypothetical protein A9309_11880 [Moraxella lacunata]OBX61817.1 hypothetical protein A9Z63_07255 [Moraxella lacunata]
MLINPIFGKNNEVIIQISRFVCNHIIKLNFKFSITYKFKNAKIAVLDPKISYNNKPSYKSK